MNGWLIGISILSLLCAFFESQQHKDYHRNHPDYEPSHTGVLGFVIVAVASIICAFKS